HSKDELIERVWTGRAVSDDCLTGAIHALRHALDDDPRDPQFIETRNTVGYRLIAEVQPRRRPRRRLAGLAAAALVVLAVTLSIDPQPLPQSAPPGPRTIAVLPFVHIAGNGEQAHLADAMTEALILSLAQRPGLQVISRTSVMPYADDHGPVRDIADALGADLLVEGSVQAEDGHLRVTAQLIDPLSDGHLWAQKFDRPFDNLLALQHEVSEAIAANITSVVGQGTSIAPPPVTADLPPDALDGYLRARYLLAQDRVGPAQQALDAFTGLSEAHPEFAPAHLGRAQALLLLFKAHAVDEQALDQALASAARFESLAGETSESHRCVGQLLLMRDWDFQAAEQRYLKGILLNPSDTVVRRRYAWLLVAQQRYEEAVAEIDQVRLLDPLYYESPDIATLLLYAERVDEALAEFARLDQTTRLSPVVLRMMAMAHLAAGQQAEADRLLVRMLEASGSVHSEAEREQLVRLNSEQLYRHILDVEPFRSRIVAAGFRQLLGQTDAALRELEQAVEARDPYVIYLDALPEFAGLRAHPRFQALLQDIGVIEEKQRLASHPQFSSASPTQFQHRPQDRPAR
ncbi:MAG: winged helix-turn-helix domain-containing protein, partial [Xanthomonadales bacterium]|nr:winged helix-turn-helix domain-containing protein [Xanthomonadales bacterium]